VSFILNLLCIFTLNSFAQEPPLEPPYTRSTQTDGAVTPLETPESISDDGDYFYPTVSNPDAIYYDLDHLPPITGAVYFRVGTISSFALEGDAGRTYKDVYGEDPGIALLFDYEWQLGQLLGKWTLKAATGFAIGNGTGVFENNPGLTPREKFLFVVMPHTVLLNYKLRFSDKQWFIPYVEGGAGYYAFIEQRNDKSLFEDTVFGGAPVGAVAGGILISLSLFDKNAAGTLYEDYGVNHMWLDLQIRRNEGFDKKKDFSSNVLSAGFGFAF
jgi:hypothetical protein